MTKPNVSNEGREHIHSADFTMAADSPVSLVPSENVSLEKKEKKQKKEEKPTSIELKMAREEIAHLKFLKLAKEKLILKWKNNARSIIKTQLEARKKLNLYKGKDWKVKFYEDKLRILK